MAYAIYSSLIVFRSGLILVAWKYFVVFTAIVLYRHNAPHHRRCANDERNPAVSVSACMARCDRVSTARLYVTHVPRPLRIEELSFL